MFIKYYSVQCKKDPLLKTWLRSEILSKRQLCLAAILRCNINWAIPYTSDWKWCPHLSAGSIWSSHRCAAAKFSLESMSWIVANTKKDVSEHLSHMINLLKQQGSAENEKHCLLDLINTRWLYVDCHMGVGCCNVALFTWTVFSRLSWEANEMNTGENGSSCKLSVNSFRGRILLV